MWPQVGAWMALGVTLWIVTLGSCDIILFDVTLWIVAGSGARMTPMLRSRLAPQNDVQLYNKSSSSSAFASLELDIGDQLFA